jgi:integrase/recombinase XerC
MHELTVSPNASLTLAESPAERLYRAFLESQTANTRAAYSRDIAAFAAFLGEPTATAAIRRLLAVSGGEGNALLLDYRTQMVQAKLASSTINRRLSAIRSAVKLARTLGHTSWTPEISGLKTQAYRDTTGPGVSGTRDMLEVALSHSHPAIALRDVALIRLMFDLALRRNECVVLDLEDVDLAGRRVWIVGKGKTEKEARTLPEKTAAALAEWIEARAPYAKAECPALFISLSGNSCGNRISGRGVHWIVAGVGSDAGIKTRPHGLRHASITAALDVNNGDVRAAQQHARHANPQTTMNYDDNRRDLAGRVADSVASLI